MAYTLSNKCAKNLSKRTVLLQLIIKNLVTCFFFGTQCILQTQCMVLTLLAGHVKEHLAHKKYDSSYLQCLPWKPSDKENLEIKT